VAAALGYGTIDSLKLPLCWFVTEQNLVALCHTMWTYNAGPLSLWSEGMIEPLERGLPAEVFT